MPRLLLTLFLLHPIINIGQTDSIVQIEMHEETKKIFDFQLGGALRLNYNLSSWKKKQMKRGGDFGYEMFRINVDAIYDRWEIHAEQRFYAQDFGGPFMKYGWFQYRLNSEQHLKIGLIPAYFGIQQFNSNSWFFQLPYYLGFEDDHDMGVSYNFENKRIRLDFGFYKNAEELSFSDNEPVSDSRYAYDFGGRNKEINQLNLRTNYKLDTLGNHQIGVSLQIGGIWNIDTQDIGTQKAIGAQYEVGIKNFNIKAQYLNYHNQPVVMEGESDESITMTAYGFPYETAAKAEIYSIGLSYTFHFQKGALNAVTVYNDYSYMDKSVDSWEDTQMNVTGASFNFNPLFIYVDMAQGKHHPWLGSQWDEALSKGDPEQDWEYRFNVNFGYYF